MKHKILGPIGLILAAGILLAFAFPSYREGEPSLAGKKAKDFPLQVVDPAHLVDVRSATHLSDLRGKVVVLNFWASWCAPCLEETQSLNKLQQEISQRGGVVLGVSMDEDKSAYEKFIAQNRVIFPTSLDSTKKSGIDYGTTMYPETYLIDRNGRLARKIVGPQDWQSAEIMGSIEILLDQNQN